MITSLSTVQKPMHPLRTVLLASALGAIAIHCGAPPANAPTVTPRPSIEAHASSPPTMSPWPAAPTLAAEDPNVSIFERVRARGAAHVPSVTIAATKSEPERALIFLGNAAALHALWVTTASTSQAVAVELPRGVRALGTVVREEKAYVWLESLAVLDQPAGMRVVLVVDTRSGKWVDSRPSPSSLAELETQLAPTTPTPTKPPTTSTPPPKIVPSKKPSTKPPALKAPDKKPQPGGDPLEALRAADKSTQALAKALPKAGVEIVRTFQTVFTQTVGKVDAASLATSPHLPLVRDAVHATAANGSCFDLVCGTVVTAREDGRIVVRRISLVADSHVAIAAVAKAKVVATSATATATEAAARKLMVEPVKQVLGEAPLGPAGSTIGVVVLDRDTERLVVVIAEPGYVAMLMPFDGTYFEPNTASYEARFADLDGDGRTDAILQVKGKYSGTATQFRYAQLASKTIESFDFRDDASLLALWSSPELDVAVAAAASLPTRGVSTPDACKLLKQLTSPAGFIAASIPKAPILTYDEPRMATWRAKSRSAPSTDWTSIAGGRDCDSLECDPDRPVCTYTDGPSKDFYWLSWPDGVLKLSGIAYYVGS